MTWWCSAQNIPWTWTWRPYPGVWLLIAAAAAMYLWSVSRVPDPRDVTPRHKRFFFAGLLALWVAADWPVGALGAGYLLSVHQAQFVLFVMTAPPLLILGTPLAVWRRLFTVAPVRWAAQRVTRPLAALLIFTTVVIATHFPEVVDGWMTSQLGTFALDLAWVVAGFALWWPVISPVPEMNALSYPARFGFLLASIVLAAAPPFFLIFSKYPLYELYELSPPIGRISAIDDQLVGGLIMKLGSTVAVFTAATIIFFKWHAAEGADDGAVAYKEELPRARV